MKNTIIILMNVLFLLVVAADAVAVKYDCDTTPLVQKSTYSQRQAQYHPVAKTANLITVSNYNI